ncbi:Nudix hydrolase 26, chloroplastic [Sesamum angolense]|uniref:Nudix hydrolase 26, chloroplastic n=1 Tax=Sesamum angolense TaxID=2727404 RepID=A0AAE1W2D9_9LAMI|nr:Nudix hydrolase 26, chloroplastic [Sesamum angolense]
MDICYLPHTQQKSEKQLQRPCATVVMALCRSFIHFNSPLQRINTANLFFPNCPSRLQKFTALSLPASFSSLSSSSMDSPPEGYRRNVGICLINPSKKIFAASRLDIPDAWQMPQGGIDESEDPRNAAIRELREETGVTSADIVAEVPYWLTYDFPPDVREKLKAMGSDWKGQAQNGHDQIIHVPFIFSRHLFVALNAGARFLLKFTGKDEEVNLLGDGTEKAEFGQWSWMSPQEIVDHAVDFKKPVYQEVLKKGRDPIDVDASSIDDIFCKQCTLILK